MQDDYLKVINDEGAIENVKIGDINKKVESSSKTSAVDSQRNTIYSENVVKIINGKYKSRKGTIKHIYKNTLFMWDKEFY